MAGKSRELISQRKPVGPHLFTPTGHYVPTMSENERKDYDGQIYRTWFLFGW